MSPRRGTGKRRDLRDTFRPSSNGADRLHLWLRWRVYDLVILDVMLPGMAGAGLAVPALWPLRCPILFPRPLKHQVEDRVKRAGAWADDYLCQLFRLPSCWPGFDHSARSCRQREHHAARADLELDLLRRRIPQRQAVDLTAKEFGLLELLMRRHRRSAATGPWIASQVWDMNFDSDTNVIEVAMRRLRVKIDEGQPVKLIQHRAGHGLCKLDGTRGGMK